MTGNGYVGWSMSVNAANAYSNGEKPLSKWRKSEILKLVNDCIQENHLELSVEDFAKLTLPTLKELCLENSSWHHTSKMYNETEFYSFAEDAVCELTQADLLELRQKEVQAREEAKAIQPKEERWECAFLEWSGTRNHPRAKEYIEVGTIRGNWFYRENGFKKNINARGFRQIRKIDEPAPEKEQAKKKRTRERER